MTRSTTVSLLHATAPQHPLRRGSYGHVGNAAVVFGFEVWVIHSVQFSNHTGYGQGKGTVLTPEHLAAVVEGLALLPSW